jgi:Xaa-Pro aminopeptidase
LINDIAIEMQKRGIQGIFVVGGNGFRDTTVGDPEFGYVAGGNLARGGVYFKRVGKRPLLVVSNLDVGTARKLRGSKRITTLTDWGMEKLSAKYGGREKAFPHLLTAILRRERVRGRVGIYGRNDLAFGLNLADQLRKLGFKVIGESTPTLIERARETKSGDEIQEIRNVGRKTARIVNNVLDAIRNAKRKRGHLQLGGHRAMVGEVKRLIGLELSREGLTAPEGTIFAIGPSAADPHNSGNASDELKPGKLIVFDIFPQSESGYWFDLTRSFVIGRANTKARRIYEAVEEAQSVSLHFLRPGVTGEAAMGKACDAIERRGFRTVREIFEGKTKRIGSGFTHSLGHGVGLTIGERPYLSFQSRDPLRVAQVVTVEPGIYLPNYGGVRIEDTVAITSRGVEQLGRVEKELELT